jgi:putative nucleotidyltransferase with HDIG domain
MKIQGSFFRSKVAQRIFFLFVLCALIPIFALFFISYTQVSTQLKNQNIRRLQNSAKAHGMSIYERFLFIESNMQLIFLNGIGQADFKEKLTKHFDAIALINSSGRVDALLGEIDISSHDIMNKALTNENGVTKVFFEKDPQNQTPAKAYMLMKNISDSQNSEILVGKININHLWGIGEENMLPPLTGLGVVDQYRKVLISSFPVKNDVIQKMTLESKGDNIRSFSYKDSGDTYFISYWPLFMQSRFDAPTLTVILRNNSSDALSALSKFKKTFPLIILLTVWIILLFSIQQIRKSLVPLERIKEGTLRVARQNFKEKVIVTSNDEFEEVADSFNIMSHQISRQFDALTTRSEIDRAILSSLTSIKIINTALKRMFLFFSCDSISINLVVGKKTNTLHSYFSNDIKIRKPQEEFFDISSEGLEKLAQQPVHILINREKDKTDLLVLPEIQKGKLFLILPLVFDGILKGTIALGYLKEDPLSDNELKHARQTADQVMVALSNASLLEDLEKLNLGALEALARAVDAKSTWTAGHTERVTILTLKIAKVMGLPSNDVEILRRAAYLHDIGKIGIPAAILDKPGKLTDEEFTVIKDHPSIGAKILEPIKAYEDIIPIVEQHHEKFDGKGYPHGLSGEDITLGARIMAVADVYDAVVSDRPYRSGWIHEKAVTMITEEAGTHFDPKVVDAFLAVI